MDLNGKVALITGGARGFGKAFAEAVLQAGGKVSLLDILVAEGLDTDQEFKSNYGIEKSVFMKCDVTDFKRLEDCFRNTHELYGGIDLVVNNAGVGGVFDDRKLIDINLNAVIKGSYLGRQYMSRDNGGDGGTIVNIGSTSGLTAVAVEEMAVYAASKHGVVGFTRNLAMAMGDPSSGHGVKVVCLCPSFTNTDILKSELTTDSRKDEFMSVGIMEVPQVVDGFIKLLQDRDNHGGVLAISPKGVFYRYPKHLHGKL